MLNIKYPALYCPFSSGINPYSETTYHHTLEWARSFNLFTDQSLCQRWALDSSSFAVCCCPKLSREALKIMSDCLLWFTLFDDECESAGFSKQLEWLTSEHARLIDILKGVELTNSDTPFARALQNIQQRLLQHGTSEWMLGFTEEVAKFFKGQFQEALNNSQGITPDLPTYIQIRSLTIGMSIFFKLILLVGRIDLPIEVVKHPLVKQIESVANNAFGSANDIISYEKEIKECHTHNLVHVLQQEYQIPVQEAIERAASLHDAEVYSFIELVAQLPSFGGEIDGNLERYISSLQSWLRGNIDWCVKAERYRINPVV